MTNNNALVPVKKAVVQLNSQSSTDAQNRYVERIERAMAMRNTMIFTKERAMIPDVHYGTIAGTNKPSLLQPGMELILNVMHWRPEYSERPSTIVDFGDESVGRPPLFHYEYECRIVDVETGEVIATAIGSCNSRESKYAYRWVEERDVPQGYDISRLQSRTSTISQPEFAIEQGRTDGNYGKPAEYWQQFRDAISDERATPEFRPSRDKTKDVKWWTVSATVYRVINPMIADQVNTIGKMAQKRALGSAVKNAACVSEFFTVDVEDNAEQSNAPAPMAAPTQPVAPISASTTIAASADVRARILLIAEGMNLSQDALWVKLGGNFSAPKVKKMTFGEVMSLLGVPAEELETA